MVPGQGYSPSFGYYVAAFSRAPVAWGGPVAELPEPEGAVWVLLHQTHTEVLAPDVFAPYRRDLRRRWVVLSSSW